MVEDAKENRKQMFFYKKSESVKIEQSVGADGAAVPPTCT
jgi:hypothetical protein